MATERYSAAPELRRLMTRPQQIFDEQFTKGSLPDGWYTDTAFPEYCPGAWDCRKVDGVIIQPPHDAWSTLRVEIEVCDIGPKATAFCGTDSRTELTLTLTDNPSARH